MRNKEPVLDEGKVVYEDGPGCGWNDFEDEDVMQQTSSIHEMKPRNFRMWGTRFVTSAAIQNRSEFLESFIMGLTNTTVEQFCKSAVEPKGEESDHVHITALSDALGVPIRVVYLDRSSCDTGGVSVSVSHHDFIPAAGDLPISSGSSEKKNPFITLLYRLGYYDILYPK